MLEGSWDEISKQASFEAGLFRSSGKNLEAHRGFPDQCRHKDYLKRDPILESWA